MLNIYRRLKKKFNKPALRFDETGERVDIMYYENINFDKLNIYEKSHFKRYELALELINDNEICGDFACGTGYGSVMLSKKAKRVIGCDVNKEVVIAIQNRYKVFKNVQFLNQDILKLTFQSMFDSIISFETIEHFNENEIESLLIKFNDGLKPNGKLMISTPFIQERSEAALKLGHHHTFNINEDKINQWMNKAGFLVEYFLYQNYETHVIKSELEKIDFIICIAKKR